MPPQFLVDSGSRSRYWTTRLLGRRRLEWRSTDKRRDWRPDKKSMTR